MRLSSSLIGLGLVLLSFAGLWQLGLLPASRATLPAPVALNYSRGAAEASIPAVSIAPSTPTPRPRPTVVLVAPTPDVRTSPAPTPRPVPLRPLAPADREDRAEYVKLPVPGYAVRLAIPSIKL